jgi:hypothetical protein
VGIRKKNIDAEFRENDHMSRKFIYVLLFIQGATGGDGHVGGRRGGEREREQSLLVEPASHWAEICRIKDSQVAALSRRLDIIAATCEDLRRFATPPYPVPCSPYEAAAGWHGRTYAEVTRFGQGTKRSE